MEMLQHGGHGQKSGGIEKNGRLRDGTQRNVGHGQRWRCGKKWRDLVRKRQSKIRRHGER